MKVTGKFDEPNVTLWNWIFLKDIHRSLSPPYKEIIQWSTFLLIKRGKPTQHAWSNLSRRLFLHFGFPKHNLVVNTLEAKGEIISTQSNRSENLHDSVKIDWRKSIQIEFKERRWREKHENNSNIETQAQKLWPCVIHEVHTRVVKDYGKKEQHAPMLSFHWFCNRKCNINYKGAF